MVGGVHIDLSKAFDCVLHDLLIAKFEAYGINENFLAYLNWYLSNRKPIMLEVISKQSHLGFHKALL